MLDFKNQTDEQIVKFIDASQKRLEEKRRPVEPIWERANEIFRPRRYDLLRLDDAVKQYGATVYDGTPQNALNKYTYGFVGYNVSRSINWVDFMSPWTELMDNDEVKDYMQNAREQILSSLNRSSFYDNVVPLELDANCCGLGVAMPREDLVNNRVDYQTYNPNECYIARDIFGNTYVFHRKLKLTAYTAWMEFGDDCPEQIKKDAIGDSNGNGSNPFKEHEFIFGAYRNDKYYKPNGLNFYDGKWVLFYVAAQGDAGRPGSRLCFKGKSAFGPVTHSPGREPGRDYGTPVCHDALTEAMILNKLSEKALKAAHLAVDPITKLSRSLRGQVLDINPGGKLYVNDGDIAEFMGDRLNWPITDAEVQRIQHSMEEKFFIRFFEMLTGRDDLPQMTAYQVSQMMGEKAVLMSPMLGSFNKEVADIVVDVQFDVETRAGRMPDVPEIMLEAEFLTGIPARPQIQYSGPLPQLQRSLLKSKGIIDSLAMIQQIGQIYPNSLRIIKEYQLMERAAIAQGAEQDLFYSEDEMAELDRQIAEEQEQARLAEAAERMAKAAPAAGTAIEPNSPLSIMGVGGAG